MNDQELIRTLEAILFSASSPLTAAKIAKAAETETKAVKKTLSALRKKLHEEDRGFQLREVAGGWQMFTNPECADAVARLAGPKTDSKLTQAALDTLTIIAYRQPVTRADVESIRGVAVGPILKTLVEKDLVRIVGKADVVGRPFLYGTTKKFLRIFGLKNLEELPRPENFEESGKKG